MGFNIPFLDPNNRLFVCEVRPQIVPSRIREFAMSLELDWITWVTGLVTAANVIAVIVMMIHGIYVRRRESNRSKRANVRRRDKEARSSGLP